MAVPVRLSDNAKCMANGNSPEYCYVNFDNENPWLTKLGDTLGVLPEFTQSPDSTFCASTYSWTTPGGSTIVICVAEDGRVHERPRRRFPPARQRATLQQPLYVIDDGNR